MWKILSICFINRIIFFFFFRTLEAWLERMDDNMDVITPILKATYGKKNLILYHISLLFLWTYLFFFNVARGLVDPVFTAPINLSNLFKCFLRVACMQWCLNCWSLYIISLLLLWTDLIFFKALSGGVGVWTGGYSSSSVQGNRQH